MKKEEYRFKCEYIYELENFQPNYKAKIVLQPSLFLHENPVSLDQIEKFSLSVHCNSEIPQIYQFPLCMPSDSPSPVFLPIEFLLPNNISSLSLSISGQLPLLCSTFQDLSSSHNIPLTQNYQEHLINQYLTRSENQYDIIVLGKNGEPVQGLGISVAVRSRF